MAIKTTTGAQLIEALKPALGFDEHARIRRIILDFNHDDVARVYIEMFGDTRILSVDWAELIDRFGVMISVQD